MSDNLCYHLKAIFTPLGIPSEHIASFVSREGALLKSNPSTYVLKMKELSSIIKIYITGDFEALDDIKLEYWRVKKLPKSQSYTTYDGRTVYSEKVISDDLIRSLMNMPISPSTLKCATGLMKLHTLAFIAKPSQSKVHDILNDITGPFSGSLDFLREIQEALPTLINELIREIKVPPNRYIPIWSTTANPNKGSFSLDSSGHSSSMPRNELLPYNLKYVLRSRTLQELYKEFPNEFISSAFTGCDVRNSSFNVDSYPTLESEPPLGRIIAIAEPGNKFRVVNMPHLLLNSLSVNLGLKLKEINSQWAVQGVDSHTKCVSDIQARLAKSLNEKRGRINVFNSVDIKAFTDRFPYKGFQSEILRHLAKRGFISEYDKSVMDIICASSYEFLDKRKVINYSVGTPMGTYPSFPLASLANGILLYHATCRVEGRLVPKNQVPGRIIGDDVVIWNQEVAELYTGFLGKLGVDVSISKCISSPYVAEMCSKIIHPLGVYEQKKLKSIDSVSSFVSNYDYYGDVLADLSAQSAEVLALCHRIPKPYGLGREVADLIESDSDMTDLELMFRTLAQGNVLRGLSVKNSLNKANLEVMDMRYRLLPKLSIGEYVRSDHAEVGLTTLYQQALLDDYSIAFKAFRAERDQDYKIILSHLCNSLFKRVIAEIPRETIELSTGRHRDSPIVVNPTDQSKSIIDDFDVFFPPPIEGM